MKRLIVYQKVSRKQKCKEIINKIKKVAAGFGDKIAQLPKATQKPTKQKENVKGTLKKRGGKIPNGQPKKISRKSK